MTGRSFSSASRESLDGIRLILQGTITDDSDDECDDCDWVDCIGMQSSSSGLLVAG